VDLAGTSHIDYPEIRPSGSLRRNGNYTPKPTQEKDGSTPILFYSSNWPKSLTAFL